MNPYEKLVFNKINTHKKTSLYGFFTVKEQQPIKVILIRMSIWLTLIGGFIAFSHWTVVNDPLTTIVATRRQKELTDREKRLNDCVLNIPFSMDL